MSKVSAREIDSKISEAAPYAIMLSSKEYARLCGWAQRHKTRGRFIAWRDWKDRTLIWVRKTKPDDPPNRNRLFNPRYLEAYETKRPVRVTLHEYDYFRKKAHVHYPYLVATVGPKGGRFIVRADLTPREMTERLEAAEKMGNGPKFGCAQLEQVMASGQRTTITRSQYVYLRSVLAASPYYRSRVIVESVNNELVAYSRN